MRTKNTKGLKIACGGNFINNLIMRECGKEGDYCWECKEHNDKVDSTKFAKENSE